MAIMAAGPALAQPLAEGLPAPNEFAPYPDCAATDANGKPTMQPYAVDPRVYGGIYLAVEQRFAPLARYFFPVLAVEDNRDWVRITRTTRGGARPPDRLTINGVNHNLLGEAGPVPVIMKIDKCSGAVLEMSFDKDKLTGKGMAAKAEPPDHPSPPAARKPPAQVAVTKPAANKPVADKPVASKSVARKSNREKASGAPSPDEMADQMIRMFGRDAEDQARANAASNAQAGDSAGQQLWLAVADIISDRMYGKGRAGTR